MIRAAALGLSLLIAAPALAGDGADRPCRTGRESYSPARAPHVVEWGFTLWDTVRHGDAGLATRQLMAGTTILLFKVADQAARAGICIPPSPNLAARHFAASAAAGSRLSMLQLAVMTAEGEGVAADPEGAVALFRRGILPALAYNGDWELRTERLDVPLPSLLAAQRPWTERAATFPNPDALTFAREFLDPAGRAKDPDAACVYLDRQSWKLPDLAFALYRLARERPGLLAARPGAGDIWLQRAEEKMYGPALAEVGRRLIASDDDIQRSKGITYLVAARNAGENVDAPLNEAIRNVSPYLARIGVEDGERGVLLWHPEALNDPALTLLPCTLRPPFR